MADRNQHGPGWDQLVLSTIDAAACQMLGEHVAHLVRAARRAVAEHLSPGHSHADADVFLAGVLAARLPAVRDVHQHDQSDLIRVWLQLIGPAFLKLSRDAQAAAKDVAVRAHAAGAQKVDVAAWAGVSRPTLDRWIADTGPATSLAPCRTTTHRRPGARGND